MRQTSERPAISCETDLGELMVAGTHEAKAIVLGGMKQGEPYGETELHREIFLGLQGDDPAYVGSPSNQVSYCIESLAPARMVARVRGTLEQRYRITQLGEHEGKAYVGHVLGLSLEAGEIGLRSLYGMARTSGEKATRPPLDRLRTFRQLLREGSVQVSDVRDNLGVSQNAASRSLLWLDASEIVDYEGMAPKSVSDQLTYTFPERLELPANEARVKQMVYDTLLQLAGEGRQHTLGQVMDALCSRYPDEAFDQVNRRRYTNGVINRLVEAGVISKNIDGKKRRSMVTLRDEARPIIERAVAIADGMLSGSEDFMEEGREQLGDILSDEEKVRTLIRKAFKASPEANGLPFERRFGHVAAYLGQNSGTRNEIAAALEAHGMTLASTQNTLEIMRRRGLAVSERIPGYSDLQWGLRARSVAAA